MPQSATTTGNGPLSAKGSAVVRNRADPRDKAENTGGLGQAFIVRDG